MMIDARVLPRDAGGQPLMARAYDYRNSARTWDIVTQTVCLAASTVCIGMRMYTKLLVLRTPRWEDYKRGNGVHQNIVAPSDLRGYSKLAYASQIVYAPLIFLTKLSIFLLYLRVFAPSRKGKTYRVIQLLIWLNLGFYLTNFLLKIFQCTPLSKTWDKDTPGHCININLPILVAAAINVASDLMMPSVPLVCCWQMHMSTRKMLGISAIFAAGIFGCFASIMRLEVSVRHRNTNDITYDWYTEFLWTTAEIILASCLPTLPNFFRHFSNRTRTILSYLSRTRGSSNPNRTWEKPKEAYALSRGRKRGLIAHDLFNTQVSSDQGREIDDDETQIFTGPRYATSEARVEGSKTPVHEILQGESGGHCNGHSQAGGILKIVEVDVETGPMHTVNT